MLNTPYKTVVGVLLGNLCYICGKNAAAVTHYTNALKDDSENVQALLGRCKARLRLNDPGALKDIDQAIEASPHPSFLLALRATLKYRLNDLPGADRDLVQAESLATGFSKKHYQRLLSLRHSSVE
jgi:Flp pilus assembly protein TadD